MSLKNAPNFAVIAATVGVAMLLVVLLYATYSPELSIYTGFVGPTAASMVVTETVITMVPVTVSVSITTPTTLATGSSVTNAPFTLNTIETKVTTTETASGSPSRKTLWDWMDLFLVPTALALGIFWLDQREKRIANESADQKEREARRQTDELAREALLDDYLIHMTLLLRTTPQNGGNLTSVELDIIRTLTMTTLQRLPTGNELAEQGDDHHFSGAPKFHSLTGVRRSRTSPNNSVRKGVILQFLYDTNLIRGDVPRISLAGADLRGAMLTPSAQLPYVNLEKANLSHAYMRTANLRGAHLEGTILSDANLQDAILADTFLTDINLEKANCINVDFTSSTGDNIKGADAKLRGADLTHAVWHEATLLPVELRGAILDYADFTRASVSDLELAKAKSRIGFIGPHGPPKVSKPQ